ncbi:MAG: hypothetical protein IPP13_01570 [Kouleothrix sp.]|jgi:hypothetical protein|nr:hypothetical protein [Kouleothrix sp.]
MPNVRKLNQDEVRTLENKGKGQRKIIEEQYDEILGEYAEGDYGEATLEPGENRLTIRNRLKAAARRRGLSIDFRRTKEDLLRFQIAAAVPAPETPAPAPVAPAPKTRGRKKKNA